VFNPSTFIHEWILVLRSSTAADIIWRIAYTVATRDVLAGAAFEINAYVVAPVVAAGGVTRVPGIGSCVIDTLICVVLQIIMVNTVAAGIP
jgi:hypothetical protein